MTIEEIEKLLSKATPGPWIQDGCKVRTPCKKSPAGYDAFDLSFETDLCDGKAYATAQFIAAAPTIIRQLLDENKKLREDLDWYRAPKMGAVKSPRSKGE